MRRGRRRLLAAIHDPRHMASSRRCRADLLHRLRRRPPEIRAPLCIRPATATNVDRFLYPPPRSSIAARSGLTSPTECQLTQRIVQTDGSLLTPIVSPEVLLD